MFRLSNCVFIFLNILTLSFGFVAIASLMCLQTDGITRCQKILISPFMVIGIIFFLVSFLGLIGALGKVTLLLWIYSFVTLLCILGLMGFMIFMLLVTKDGSGMTLSGIGFKEYRLRDYLNWLQKQIANGKNWNDIRSCLAYSQICSSLAYYTADMNAEDFYKTRLSHIESGCCKPPVHCGFKYKNATFWIVPKSGPAVQDSDCTTWSNEQDKLCYDCNSCKGGVLADIRLHWRNFVKIISIHLVIITVLYSISCCARKNIQSDLKYTRV